AGALGIYTIAYRFGLYSSTNIVSMLGRVLFPVYSRIQSDVERVKRAYLKSFYPVAIIVFPVAIGVVVLAGEFVYFVLGPKWTGVEVPLRILSVYGLFYSLAAIGSNVFLALRRQQIPLKVLALEVLLMLGILYPAAAYGGLFGVAAAVTIATVAGSSVSIILVMKILKIRSQEISKMIVNPLVSSISMGLAMFALKVTFPISPALFALELILGLAVYIAVMRGLSGDDLENQIREIVSAFRAKRQSKP
ncbi:MAG: oligosaccharide flippase family protein, partial [Thermoplasmata archaeon]